jgi:hypothetical protein
MKYGDLETSLEGEYSEVWKLSNDFLKGIRQNLDTKNPIFSIKDKSVPDIIIDLRNGNYFNTPKSSPDCFNKFKELGKTGITPNAISMALKSLVEKGELTRREDLEKPGKFVYSALCID